MIAQFGTYGISLPLRVVSMRASLTSRGNGIKAKALGPAVSAGNNVHAAAVAPLPLLADGRLVGCGAFKRRQAFAVDGAGVDRVHNGRPLASATSTGDLDG